MPKTRVQLPIVTLNNLNSLDNFDNEFRKDCPGYKETPIVMEKVKRIIAIGDIHGDFNLAIESFKLAELVDSDMKWIGKDTIVVQVGDQIDSCRPTPDNDCQNKSIMSDKNSDVKIIEFFNEMDEKARKEGGMVISLLGNHEIMNVQGNFGYVSKENMDDFEYQNLKGKDGRYEAFEQGGPFSKMMACTRHSTVIVGSHIFVHAGILPALITRLEKIMGPVALNAEISKYMLEYAYLNQTVRKWMLGKLKTNSDMKAILNSSKTSPFWPRIYGNIKPGEPYSNQMCQKYLKPVLDTLKMGHMIIGHTPQGFDGNPKNDGENSGINATCGGKVFRVDGGFAKAFQIFNNGKSNKIQVLEIIDDSIYNVLTQKI